jgi:hypothetical protein
VRQPCVDRVRRPGSGRGSEYHGGLADGRVAGGENAGDAGTAVVVDNHHPALVELAAEPGRQGTWRESGRVEQSGAVVARPVGEADSGQPAVLGFEPGYRIVADRDTSRLQPGLLIGSAPVRAAIDARDRKPAEKRWEWIRKGVPLVIELGERDLEQGVATVTRRDDDSLSRDPIPRDGVGDAVVGVLGDMQTGYLEGADRRLRERTRDDIATLEEFREFFSGDETDSGGFVKAPWCEDPATEEVMAELGVTVRCIPFGEQLPPDPKCVITGGPATTVAIFAKAY